MLMMTGVAAVVLAAIVLWFSPLRPQRWTGGKNFFGAALLAAWVVGVAASSYESSHGGRPAESELMTAVRDLGPIDWERRAVQSTRLRTAVPSGTVAEAGSPGSGSGPVTDVAPVASLIGGLEARLAQDPADAKGWALLAQSYAFLGRMDEANEAGARAVELGFDEASLRARVQSSTRELHTGNWIEQAIRR